MSGLIDAMFPELTPEQRHRIALAVVESWHPPAPENEDFSVLTWSLDEIEKQGNRLAKALIDRPNMEREDKALFIALHSAVGQLAQIHRALR